MDRAGLRTRTSDGLSEIERSSGELSAVSEGQGIIAEVQAAIVVARKFPRDEIRARTNVLATCERPSFAPGAAYEFPRGGSTVYGPSVKLAREIARCWGNIRYGLTIVSESDEQRHIRGWAWDLETNTRIQAEDTFAKRVFRRFKGGEGGSWIDISGDEREMRELTNRRGAICVRNCLLQLVPYDLIEDALSAARHGLEQASAADPDGLRHELADGFGRLGIGAEEIGRYMGKGWETMSSIDLAKLRAVLTSIEDGNSKWSDYARVADRGEPMPKAKSEGAAPKEPAQPPLQKGQRELTGKQIKFMFAKARSHGYLPSSLKKVCQEEVGCGVDDLTRDQFERVLALVQKVAGPDG